MTANQAETRARLAEELREALVPQLLERWYPRVVDEEFGGFYSDLSMDFEVEPDQRKEIVTQARHVWTTSKAALLLPSDPRYPRAAEHGYRYLRDVMWDHEEGGFLPRVYARASDGVWPGAASRRPPSRLAPLTDRLPRNRATRALASAWRRRRGNRPRPMVKTTYDQAFGIFALAAFYAHSGDTTALTLAQDTYSWLNTHAADPEHGGYVSFLSRDGTQLEAGPDGQPPKDFDSVLHVVEAFTELYRVWPDPGLRDRLTTLIDLISAVLVAPRGTGWVTFEGDWQPVRLRAEQRRRGEFRDDHISFGHDIETAALLIDATDALQLDDRDSIGDLARRMTDHSLANGWDEDRGGIFHAGYYDADSAVCQVVDPAKFYWVQGETLNTLSLLATHFPDVPRNYPAALLAHWEYCKRYMIDYARGGWYFQGLDALAESAQPGKARPIHGTYHVGRALMNALAHASTPRPTEGASAARGQRD